MGSPTLILCTKIDKAWPSRYHELLKAKIPEVADLYVEAKSCIEKVVAVGARYF
jgi:hypothetical protein